MYGKIKDLRLSEQVEALTRELVSVKSVNGTDGELAIADRLVAIIRTFPYFNEHPDLVWTAPLKHDALGRKSVFALLEGQPSARTVIYHGHIDTVGIDDFGALEQVALDPDALRDYFAKDDKDADVQADARSGEWLFGRGALDMKSGDAIHLVNLLYYSQHRRQLNGHLLVMFNPVEENDHRGMIDALEELERLKDARGLDYQLAINTDFVSPLYKGDSHRYVYTGAAGKLLACFYIRGRETHVGETLSGIDPTLVAAKINSALNNNMDAAERIPGEVVLPPSCLYMRDRKAFYNVQTAGSVRMYFNYFVYERAPEAILSQLTAVAEQACADTAAYLSEQYKVFAANSGLTSQAPDWSVPVVTFAELSSRANAQGIDVNALMHEACAVCDDADYRQTSFHMIEALETALDDKRPKVVVFFAPPYCPHNYLRQEVEAEQRIDRMVSAVLAEAEHDLRETFTKKRFFPYLSDSSYLSTSETEEQARTIHHNFPGWGDRYHVPLDLIRKLNIPALDVGVYGKRAHTWKERVYKPYSFEKLPRLIRTMTERVLEQYN